VRPSHRPWLSGREHFEVWPHDSIEPKRLRDLIEFVQVEASAPPRFDEGFQRNVQADFVSKSKAIDNRSGDAVDPHHAAFDAMLFDSEIEERWRDPCHAQGRVCNRRDASAARNGEPHLPGKLRPEVVEEKSRRETDDTRRDDAASQNKRVMLGHAWRRQPVSSRADLFERAGPRKPGQRASVNAVGGDVPGTEEGARSGKGEHTRRGRL
jgi:hypothetical protein